MFNKIFNLCAIIGWQTIACGIGNIYHGCPCFDNRLYNLSKILIISTTGILGIKLYVLDIAFGIFHSCHGALKDLFASAVKLIFDVTVACSDTCMYALVLGILQRIGRNINILLHGTCQGAYRWPCYSLANLYDRVEIARTGNGKSCLNNIYAQLLQLFGHLNLLHGVELTAWHLFTITKRGVKNK